MWAAFALSTWPAGQVKAAHEAFAAGRIETKVRQARNLLIRQEKFVDGTSRIACTA